MRLKTLLRVKRSTTINKIKKSLLSDFFILRLLLIPYNAGTAVTVSVARFLL